MIDTVNLRQTLCNEFKSSQKIKDFCSANFGSDTFFIFAGVDIENTPSAFPMIGVRVPKVIKTTSESEAFLLIDLQIKGLDTPIKSGVDVPFTYFDEESLSEDSINVNTLTNYNGDEVLDSFRDVIVSEVERVSDSLCDLTIREYDYEQDLITTFPVYSGFLVFRLFKENNL